LEDASEVELRNLKEEMSKVTQENRNSESRLKSQKDQSKFSS